jgi:hypothetical protein
MGLGDLFKAKALPPAPLPSGSFTVDSAGEILVSTIPGTFPMQNLQQISALVLKAFREARELEMTFSELIVQFGGINVTAREMRGGAIVFLSPRGKTAK